ncbi:MAG: signal peptide peptidase SppA [Bacteroidales bacterium]|nr:signal peptide peptidase SppA [Bacteroidales bacterium]
MGNFFKYVLASMLGTLVVLIIFFFISMLMISAFVSLAKQDKVVEIKNNSVFTLTLDKPIKDRKPSMPFLNIGFPSLRPETFIGLNDILDNIEKAKKDPKIKGIFLDLSSLQAGIGTIDEIRNALIDFRESGKFIISYGDFYLQPTYYLASVADEIYINPEGILFLKGLRVELMFFTETFKKLGIEPQVVRHGEFKSAVEPFTEKSMSDENRLQVKAFMGSIWQYMVDNISKERNVEPEKINKLVDRLELWNTLTALEENMVDSLVYRDQVYEILMRKSGLTGKKKPSLVSYSDYNKVPKAREQKGLIRQKIAVIYAEGDIVPGEGEPDEVGADKFVKAISEARQDSNIRAIVLRVNSPGGFSIAAEMIWREIDLAARIKPVIASMGDLAASGGYYILASADTIVASPVTLTGSIGVFGIWWSAKELYNKKLGITSDVEMTNTYADFGTTFRSFTPYERIIIQQSIDKTYDTFVDHVSKGRKLSYNEVDKIGEGRVWSGINGLDIGLVDVFGGLKEAIRIAAEKAGLESYRIVNLPRQEDPFEVLMKEIMGEMKVKAVRKELGEDFKYYELLNDTRKLRGIQTRLPFTLDIQ